MAKLIEVDDVRGKATKQMVCSLCGAKFTRYKADRKLMNARFAEHVQADHPREDVNQAAARIVKEATKDK